MLEFLQYPARWAGLGNLLDRWPEVIEKTNVATGGAALTTG